MLSPVRLSVVCLSVTSVHPILSRLKFLAMFLRHLVPWPWPSTDIHGKFYGDRSRGTSLSAGRGLNARGVTKYSDLGLVEGYISETVKIGGKLVLITNRKL